MYCLWYLQENNSPIVTIIEPNNDVKFNWGGIVPYMINISDQEDGSSEFGEIPTNEVILTVKYLSDATKVTNYLKHVSKNNLPILSWMGRSNCFSCHSAKDPLIGPSFEEIAKRYQGNTNIQETLAKKILNGTTGTWGDQIMPAQPNLDPKMVNEVVEWILNKNTDTDYSYYSGLEGAIHIKQSPQDKTNGAVCVLIAHYLDHVVKKGIIDEKMGENALMLRIK